MIRDPTLAAQTGNSAGLQRQLLRPESWDIKDDSQSLATKSRRYDQITTQSNDTMTPRERLRPSFGQTPY